MLLATQIFHFWDFMVEIIIQNTDLSKLIEKLKNIFYIFLIIGSNYVR